MSRNFSILALLVLTVLMAASGASAVAPRTAYLPGSRAADKPTFAPDRVVLQIGSSSMNRSIADLDPQMASPGVALGIPSLDAVSARVGAASVTGMFMQAKNAVEATRVGLDRFVIVKLAPGSDLQAAISAYAADPNVDYAGPDYYAHLAVVPTDPVYTDHWGHNNTKQLPSWDYVADRHFGPLVGDYGFDARAEPGWGGPIGFGDPNVIIGIVDTGVDLSHPDLTLVPGFDFGDWDNDPSDDAPDAGHGTACAGVAAGKANNGLGACGAAPGSSIMPLKVVNSDGDITFSAIAVALVWGADHGADILSLSLGAFITSEPGVDAGIVYATGAGATILAAAGNFFGPEMFRTDSVEYPANHPDVIAVGAAAPCEGRKRSSSDDDEALFTDPNGVTCDNEGWWGSSYGPDTRDHAAAVDILAPSMLVTTDIQGAGGYAPGDYHWYFNGTSCATPYAAGVCALIKSRYPHLAPWQISSQLTGTARDVVNVESGVGWDRYSGYGLVDIAKAVGCSEPPVVVPKDHVAKGDMDECIIVSVSDIDNGSYDPNGPGDVVSLFITHVDGAPVGNQFSVSVCGDGPHTVTLTMTDACGNLSTANAHVQIVNSPPVVYAKRPTVDADQNCCTVVHVSDIDEGSFDPDGEEDIMSFCITALDGVAVGCEDSVTVCGEGSHTVDLTMTDLSNESVTVTTDLTITDATPPTIEVVLSRDVLWPPNHKLVEICAEITTTDNCDADLEVVLVDVWSDEPENDNGDGNTETDIAGANVGTADTCLSLRSERSGTGDGRRYTLVYSATDRAGNASSDTVSVRVPRDKSASALAAAGFNANGTALNGDEQFALVIPTTDTMDAALLDVNTIYLGNTAGVVRATKTRVVDVNGDERPDLALLYRTEGLNLTPGSAQYGRQENAITLDRGDGPLGVHFVSPTGVDCLVRDIFTLGKPVEIPGGWDRDSESTASQPTPESKEAMEAAFSSIYPNPFNPSTTISWSLPVEARGKLEVFDIKGRLVVTLVDGMMPAGPGQVVWNGTDATGSPVSSGVYLYRLKTDDFAYTKRMVLVK